MFAALDAHYDEDTLAAVGAAVVFGHWQDPTAASESTALCERAESYVPGEFYRRELPCLLAVLKRIADPLDAIVIDGYVSLGDRPGLGMRLWEAINRETPIIGVAKTQFEGADAAEVNRGQSTQPLYVTATGNELLKAVAGVKQMAGDFRIPTLLKRVDRLARDELERQLNGRPKK